MIDVFANYLFGVEFWDRFRYRLVTPCSTTRKNCVTIHHLPSKYIVNRLSVMPCCVNLIDTPGFSTNSEFDNIEAIHLIRALFTSMGGVDLLIHCENPNDKGSIKIQ